MPSVVRKCVSASLPPHSPPSLRLSAAEGKASVHSNPHLDFNAVKSTRPGIRIGTGIGVGNIHRPSASGRLSAGNLIRLFACSSSSPSGSEDASKSLIVSPATTLSSHVGSVMEQLNMDSSSSIEDGIPAVRTACFLLSLAFSGRLTGPWSPVRLIRLVSPLPLPSGPGPVPSGSRSTRV